MSRTHYFAVASLALIATLTISYQPAPASATTVCYTQTRDLYVGITGEDVKNLQQILNLDNPSNPVSVTGAGSPGNETTYFGSETRDAVRRFQTKHNVSPVSGYVGPVTKIKLLSLYPCGDSKRSAAPATVATVERGNAIWANHMAIMPGQNQKTSKATSVAVDKVDNLIIGGSFSGNVDFGGGQVSSVGNSLDGYVAKYDGESGRYLWVRSIGATSFPSGSNNTSDLVKGIATDIENNVYVIGQVVGTVDVGTGSLVAKGLVDIILAKYSPSGQIQWARRFGSSGSDIANAIAVHGNQIFITGTFGGGLSLGGSNLPNAGGAFAASFSTESGSHLWSRVAGDGGNGNATALAILPNGDVVVGGSFMGTMNVGGINLVSTNAKDAWLASFAGSDGRFIWSKQATGSTLSASRGRQEDEEYIMGIATDSAGNVIVTGVFYGNISFGGETHLNQRIAMGSNIFLAKLNGSNGGYIWSRGYSPNGALYLGDSPFGVATSPQDQIFLTGTIFSDLNFGDSVLRSTDNTYDAFLAAFNADGIAIWSKRYHNTVGFTEAGNAVTADSVGNPILAGSFTSRINLGNGEMIARSLNNGDGFVAKIATGQAPVVQPVTVQLTGPAAAVANGASASLTWDSTNASGCTASAVPAVANWSGAKLADGTQSAGPLTVNTRFTLTCSGTGGNATQSVEVAVQPVVVPLTADIKAMNQNGPITVDYNNPIILSWVSTGGADRCSVTPGNYTGTTNSVTTGPIVAETTYTLTCYRGTEQAQDSVRVLINIPAVSATLTTTNTLPIPYNSNVTLNWNSINASSCTASGGWTGSKSTTGGTQVIGPLTAATDFYLTCTGINGVGTVAKNIRVTVQSAPQPTAYTLTVNNSGHGKIYGSAFGLNVPAGGVVINCGSGGNDCSETATASQITEIVLSATPDAGYRFGSWSGSACEPGQNFDQCDILMNANKTVNATFIQLTEPLTADIKINGQNGPVTISPNTSVTVSWGSTGASSCVVVPSRAPGVPNSYSLGNTGVTHGPLSFDTTYTLTCYRDANITTSVSVQDTARVIVTQPVGPPMPAAGNLNAKINMVALDGGRMTGAYVIDAWIYQGGNYYVSSTNLNANFYYGAISENLTMDVILPTGYRVDHWEGCVPVSPTSTRCERRISNATMVNGIPTIEATLYLAPITTAGISAQSGIAGVLGALDQQSSAPVADNTNVLQHEWTRDLQIGSPHLADVIALQGALRIEGVYDGDITGGFYNQTYTAVKKFQEKYGISPVSGYVGALTRAKLNELY